MTTAPQTKTQQFAAQYTENVVPNMLKTIKKTHRTTKLIMAGVLAITYPHQAGFLASVEGVDKLGYLIPAVIDLSMLSMVGITQTIGMRRNAKIGALVMTGVLGAISGTVNAAAPAVLFARIIFTALVLVAVGVKIVSSLVGPDFNAIEAAETSSAPASAIKAAQAEAEARLAAEVTRLAAEAETARQAEAARVAAALAAAEADAEQRRQAEIRSERSRRAAQTLKERKEAARQAEIALMEAEFDMADAPVSGAPATH